ncbi:MAG TPA: hemin uptake protein HemP [Dokdonella sp.]
MFEHHLATPVTSSDSTHASPINERRARTAAPQRIGSVQLLAGGNELVIEHAGQEYRLRLTRNDKLILTK